MDVGDPANYVLPDVNCDFTKVTMTQSDDKNVKIQGAIGKPPTETFKVSATYMDGFKATCVSIINGGQAGAKAHAVANAILDRSRAINKFMGMGDFEDTYVTAIGNEESFGKNASKVCIFFFSLSIFYFSAHLKVRKFSKEIFEILMYSILKNNKNVFLILP